jgi:spore germination protein YaaH
MRTHNDRHNTVRGMVSRMDTRFFAGVLTGILVTTLAIAVIALITQDRPLPLLPPTPEPPALPDALIMAWVFPGEPGCNAPQEYRDGRRIDVLKPEYYTVEQTGSLRLRTEEADGCNAYSPENVEDIKAHSIAQFVTVSAEPIGMRALVSDHARRARAIATLHDFVSDHDFTGVEIDFEGFSDWTVTDYEDYQTFLVELAEVLHADNKKLMVDVPPIGNDLEQSYYVLRYEDLNDLPVDFIVIMAYDYQYDHGAGSPIAPNVWVEDIIDWALARIDDPDRIVIGLPSYGYRGETDNFEIIRGARVDLTQNAGFENYTRDPDSYEKIWQDNGVSFVVIDSEALDAKRALIESRGIQHLSVWALGGNEWFSH